MKRVFFILFSLWLFFGARFNPVEAQIYTGQGAALVTPEVKLEKANGMVGNPSDVQTGDTLGVISATGRLNGQQQPAALIRFGTDGTPSGTDLPARISFETGGDSLAEQMVIDNDGNVGIGIENPSEKLEILGNMRLRGPGNRILFPDGTWLRSARDLDTIYVQNMEVTNFMKFGDSSMYVGALSPTSGYEIYVNTSDLLIQSNGAGIPYNTILNAPPNVGKVGIGTPSPTEKLHVAGGGVRVENLGGSGLKLVEADVNGTLGAKAYSGTGTDVLTGDGNWTAISSLVGTGGGDSDWSGAGTGKMYATSTNDHIGIGTSNPGSRLQIRQDSSHRKEGISIYPYVPTYTIAQMAYIWKDANNQLHIHNGIDESNGLTLSYSGKLGINNANPSARLHITQGSHTNDGGIWLQSPSYDKGFIYMNQGDLMLTNDKPGSGAFRGLMIADGEGYIGINKNNPGARLTIGQNDTTDAEGIRLIYGTNSGRIWMNGTDFHLVRGFNIENGIIIKSDGAVGIKTSDVPAGYKLAVNGKIISEEIRVELKADWPDYVFDEGYDLIPLQEVRRRIELNGHLPGMPSAKEITEKGQHLGAIQLKMLEKIEEMMLYILELEEENQSFREELEAVKAKFK